MQRRIITITLQTAALIACMTAGWHVWPLAIGFGIALGLHTAGFTAAEDNLDQELHAMVSGASRG